MEHTQARKHASTQARKKNQNNTPSDGPSVAIDRRFGLAGMPIRRMPISHDAHAVMDGMFEILRLARRRSRDS
ncbi:hypothetical protein EYC84_011484 [Monilinia fructicola]|uniref:Uncharacterized protein n=1 Tax=Monilinia fructicola TaxID=38448 RepID=A0A5M9J5C7_MONFR|nr:hypothetical protein EYC84_011484 [Monilinia fructicola]